jgi:CheY-like chemotaxis protein
MATILLVDAVQVFIELEKSFLENAGYSVATATSGEEALEKLSQVNPSLLLLDLYLPGIDGDEVCRRLHSSDRWQSLPIIMVTAAGTDEEIRKCLDAGCADYLTKPVQKKILLEKVKRLFGTVKARTEERKAFDFQVQVNGAGRQFTTTARDLSRNGIYLNSSTTMPPETLVELKVRLSADHDIVLLGKVKRIQEGPDGGIGIYFIRPEEAGNKELDRLLQETGGAGLLADTSPAPDRQQPQPGPEEKQKLQLHEENQSLIQRIKDLEKENQEFAHRIVTTEEANNNLTNLYIASSRLHSVLDRSQVIEIINEVVINLVGAEKFVLALHDKESQSYPFESGEGLAAGDFPPVHPGNGLLGRVVVNGEHFFQEGLVAAGSDDLQHPLAAIPLTIHDTCIGLLAIYRLFTQKQQFEEIDFQLFRMMAEHAAIALFSATLYEASERKRQTYQGVMDLLLK